MYTHTQQIRSINQSGKNISTGKMRITKYNEDNVIRFNSKHHSKGEMLQPILLK